MDLVQNVVIKIKKLSVDLVHDRGSMDPFQRGGPWTPGPCFVLTRWKLLFKVFVKSILFSRWSVQVLRLTVEDYIVIKHKLYIFTMK